MDPDKARAAARADEDVQRVRRPYRNPDRPKQDPGQLSENSPDPIDSDGLQRDPERPKHNIFQALRPSVESAARTILGIGDPSKTPEPVGDVADKSPLPKPEFDIKHELGSFYKTLYATVRKFDPSSGILGLTPKATEEVYDRARDIRAGMAMGVIDVLDATVFLAPHDWQYDEFTDTAGYTKDPRIRTRLEAQLKGSKAEQIGVDALILSSGYTPEELQKLRSDPNASYTNLMTGDVITAKEVLEAKAELWRDATLEPTTLAGMAAKMMSATTLSLIVMPKDAIDPYHWSSALFFAVPPATTLSPSLASFMQGSKALSTVQRIRAGSLQSGKLVHRTTLGQDVWERSHVYSLSSYDELDYIFDPNIFTRVLKLPGMRFVASKLGASASVADNPIAKYAAKRLYLRAQADLASRKLLANLERLYPQGLEGLGIKLDSKNRWLAEGKSYHLRDETDIALDFGVLGRDLPEKVKGYLRLKVNMMTDAVTELEAVTGIKVNKITPGFEGAYLPRIVIGKEEVIALSDVNLPMYIKKEASIKGGIKLVKGVVNKVGKVLRPSKGAAGIESAVTEAPKTRMVFFDKKKGSTIGSSKKGMLKERQFRTNHEALEETYVMSDPDTAYGHRIIDIFRLMGDTIADEGLLTTIPFRVARVPEHIRLDINTLKHQLRYDRVKLREAQLILKERTKVSNKMYQRIRSKAEKRTEKVRQLENDTENDIGVTPAVYKKEIKSLNKSIKNLDRDIKQTVKQYTQQVRKKNTPAFRNLIKIQNRFNARAQKLPAKQREWQKLRKRWEKASATEGTVAHSGFAGKIFERATAQEIDDILAGQYKEAHKILEIANRFNAVGRLFTLTMDAGVFMIQLILMAGRPKVFGESIVGGVRAMVDPQYIPNLYWKNRALLAEYPELMLTSGGHTEMTEALRHVSLGRKAGVISKARDKIFSPAQRLFEGAMDTAGIEMMKAHDYKTVTAADRAALTSHINSFRGLVDTTKLGISAQQRAVESLLLLAPRYNRAIAGIVLDIFKGGLRGNLARESLIRATTAGMFTAFGLSLAAGESVDEALQHINPADRKNFMTWTIAGQRVGPGSKFMSLIRLFSSMAKQAHTDPRDVMLWGVETPRKFLRGNLSPVLRTIVDLWEGEDYLGYPTRNNVMDITDTVIARNLMPFWMHSVLMEDGPFWDLGEDGDESQLLTKIKGAGLRAGAEFAGGRAWALTPSGKFQQRVSEKENLSYDQIPLTRQQHYMTDDPETKALWELAEADAAEREGGSQYLNALNQIKEDEMLRLSENIDDIIKENVGKRAIREAFSEYHKRRNTLSKKAGEDFAKAKRRLEAYIAANPAVEFESQLWDEYQKIAYDDKYERDDFRGFDFESRDEALTQWREKVGEDSWQIIQNVVKHYQREHHPLIQELLEARRILRPYWNTLDIALSKWGAKGLYEEYQYMSLSGQAQFVESNAALRVALAESRDQRKVMEATNDDVARALMEWDYRSSVNNSRVMSEFRR